jgi:hypothetical protein|tara:strand:- start:612 stop:983 length:372 start_codon:yes stop_codon:yes gene_type:complete
MASFAKLDENNVVTTVVSVVNEVILDSNGVEQEQLGVIFLNKLYNTNDNWKQTSYNGNFRKNHAGVGYTYDETKDAFISFKPYASWILNEDTCIWEAPIAYPDDGEKYAWNESTSSWDLSFIS